MGLKGVAWLRRLPSAVSDPAHRHHPVARMARDQDGELVPPPNRKVHKGKQLPGSLAPPTEEDSKDPVAPVPLNNATRCRPTGECERCLTSDYMALECKETGFREMVDCSGGNGTRTEGADTFRACYPPEDSFGLFGFLFLNLVILMVAVVVVRWRRKVEGGERNVSFKRLLLSFFKR